MSRHQRPVDQRGRLDAEPFGYVVTKNGQIRISYEDRVVTTVAGGHGDRLAHRLERADPAQFQLLLAKATGNFSSAATNADPRQPRGRGRDGRRTERLASRTSLRYDR